MVFFVAHMSPFQYPGTDVNAMGCLRTTSICNKTKASCHLLAFSPQITCWFLLLEVFNVDSFFEFLLGWFFVGCFFWGGWIGWLVAFVVGWLVFVVFFISFRWFVDLFGYFFGVDFRLIFLGPVKKPTELELDPVECAGV